MQKNQIFCSQMLLNPTLSFRSFYAGCSGGTADLAKKGFKVVETADYSGSSRTWIEPLRRSFLQFGS